MKCLVLLPSPESPALRAEKKCCADYLPYVKRRCRQALCIAGDLKKSCGAGAAAVSAGYDLSGGMIPYALAAAAGEGIYLRLTERQIESPAAEGAIYAMLAGKIGHYDILISAYNENFSRALAEYIGINFICCSRFEICGGAVFPADMPGERQAAEAPVMICLKEQPDEYCRESRHGGGAELNFADIREADSKPFYLWNETDAGIDISSCLKSNIPKFEKVLLSVRQDAAAAEYGGLKLQGGCVPAVVSPAEAAAEIAELFSAYAGSIIIGGGRGLNAAGARCLRHIAECSGFTAAATRPAVQAGLLPASCLAGPHIRAPRADLYAAFGISGAPLHMAGINARHIAAVNINPSAPVFSAAEKGFVCDANAVLEILSGMPYFKNNNRQPKDMREESVPDKETEHSSGEHKK